MTVYVDDMHLHSAGPLGCMKMSHLLADTDKELHAMADKIGMTSLWHQAPLRNYSHYEIAMSKQAQALTIGAMNMHHRVTGQLGEPATAEAWLQEHMAAKRAAKEGAA